MVTLKVLPQTNLQEDYVHSVLISLLRGFAALDVAAAHLRAEVYPGYSFISSPPLQFTALAFFTGFAHQAVVVFFLLSGWLVGGSLLNKGDRENAIKHYAVDRLTRLWTVLIPTFVLMLIFSIAIGKVNGATASFALDNEFSAATFVGNLVGLQNILVPVFGGDFPLWSLSNETWYYVMFPILVISFRTESAQTRLCALLALVGLAVLLSGPLLLYFSIWLMGAGCSRLKVEAGRLMQLVFLVVFLSVSVYFRLRGQNNGMELDTFVQDYIFSVAFLLFLASMQNKLAADARLWAKAQKFGKFFADFSFTLYVLHVPIIAMIVHASGYLASNRLSAHNPAHLAAYFAMLLLIVTGAYLFHLPFEANTYRLRRHIKRLISYPNKSAVSA
jgi:peptidoglycan/LPS O-acetylase OafA/YrhL